MRARLFFAFFAFTVLTLASGCKKKRGPLFVKATATSAEVKDYKDTMYAKPEAREIVTIEVESHPRAMVILTGVGTLDGKTRLETFTDDKGKGKLSFRQLDIKGPLALEVLSSDPKTHKSERATLTDIPIQRAPGLHVVYGNFEIVPGTCKGQFGRMMLTASGCPDGTVFTIGTATGRTSGGALKLPVDLSARLGELPARLDVSRPVPVPLTMTVTLPDGRKFSQPFDATGLEQAARDRLAGARSGPVTFGPGDTKGTRHGAVLVNERSFLTLGDAQVAREIDVVAYQEKSGSRTSSCGRYVQRSTGNAKTLTLLLEDARVAAYDRRSGRLLGTRVFPGRGSCGDTAHANDGGFYGGPDEGALQKWVTGLAR